MLVLKESRREGAVGSKWSGRKEDRKEGTGR